MNRHEKAIEVLIIEYVRLGGVVFGEVFRRNCTKTDEQKKALEASDMMLALISGKSLKTEWKLEEVPEYKQLINLVDTINYLSGEIK